MSRKYDFDAIVIGGGAAGLTAAGIAANLGAKTMLVEADKLGGDCTWTGCVPSKTLLKAAKVAHQVGNASKYGLIDTEPEINFQALIEHVHQVREGIYEEADRPEHFERMGIEVIQGRASFINEHTIEIALTGDGARRVTSRYFFICTGSRPQVPPIEGIEEVEYLTNERLFELEELPGALIIAGAGPVGTEMAQAFNRLGSNVTVIEMADRILTKDDPELATRLRETLEREGIDYRLNAKVKSVSQDGEGIAARIEQLGSAYQIEADRLLIATGRYPNIDGLGLENTGIYFSERGIEVDKHCRTNRKHIYACGDVTGRYQLTHMSDHMAKVAVTNALLKYPMKIDAKHVPWVTYTDPELGHLGATSKQLDEADESYETHRFPYKKIDRAVTESEAEGLIKIYARKWSGKILGVDILGTQAGELISEYAVAMRNGVSLRNIADTIHPYPSWGLGARRAADQWYIKNQKAWQVKLIKKLFGYRGEVPDFSDSDRVV